MTTPSSPSSPPPSSSSGIFYPDTYPATFLHRPNRFIAHALLNGEEIVCHVKNTGRCKELLLPGASVVVQKAQTIGRKTPYSLLSVWKGDQLINIDSSAPNPIFAQWMRHGGVWEVPTLIRAEKRFEDSRLDFFVQWEKRQAFIEVKGVTLEEDGIARFPDAPTERGVKHLHSLISAKQQGYEAYGVFIIQMQNVSRLEPNWKTHAAFGEAMILAQEAGVKFLAMDCIVTPNSVTAHKPIPIFLQPQ